MKHNTAWHKEYLSDTSRQSTSLFIFYLFSDNWQAYKLNGVGIQQFVGCHGARWLDDGIHRVEHRVAVLMELFTYGETMLVVVIQLLQCCTHAHAHTHMHTRTQSKVVRLTGTQCKCTHWYYINHWWKLASLQPSVRATDL